LTISLICLRYIAKSEPLSCVPCLNRSIVLVTYRDLFLIELVAVALWVAVSFRGGTLVVICYLDLVCPDFSFVIPTTLAAVSVSHDFQFNI
jgi:hypothetical protein